MFQNYPKLYQDPHIDYPIDNLNLNFSDYITKSKKILEEYRIDLNQHPGLIIESNAPFELQPATPIYSEKNPAKIKYGALLIHGLFDTPFIMKDIGKHLQAQGLLVRSVILPGHGTVPGSLLNTKYEDWLRAVRYGIASLTNKVEKIFLVGFSTGASLSIYHTLQNPEHIAGLIMLAPAFKINSALDFTSNWHQAVSWAVPRAKWFYIGNEIDYTKYCSVPFNAVYQVYRLTQAIKKIDHTREPPCPLFISLSYDDRIVCSKTTIQYFCGYSNPNNKMILYASSPYQNTDPRIMVRSSIYPEMKITSFSHISIPIAPSNPHYGKTGDYPLSSRVDEKNHYVYGTLDRGQKKYYDLLYKLKLIPYQKQRLTFNPDFDCLMHELDAFMAPILK